MQLSDGSVFIAVSLFTTDTGWSCLNFTLTAKIAFSNVICVVCARVQLQAGPANMRRKSVVVTATVLIVGVLVPADIAAAVDYKLWVNNGVNNDEPGQVMTNFRK